MIDYWLYSWGPFLIIGAIFCLIGYRAYSSRIRQKEKLKNIAVHLGFTFSDEGTDDESAGAIQTSNQELSPMRRFLRTIAGWQMKGRMNGVETKIYTKKISSGKHSHEYTCIDALIPWNSSSSLLITRETSLSRLGKAIFDMQDIQTGNEDLDRRVVMKGAPEHFVKRILLDSSLQAELLSLFELEGTIFVDQHGVHFQTPQAIVDEQRYRQLLDRLTRTASALERAT
jgi:hypothetical protein